MLAVLAIPIVLVFAASAKLGRLSKPVYRRVKLAIRRMHLAIGLRVSLVLVLVLVLLSALLSVVK